MAKLRAFIPLFLAMAALLIAAAGCYGMVNSQAGNGKYDADGDGLIEVSYLEQLDAIRYDMDGDGQADAESVRDAYAAAFPVSSSETICLANCNGYELARSLDFKDPRSYASDTVNPRWTSGDGWLPIGNENNRFWASFNGNGNTLSNLYIYRITQLNDPGAVGLFGNASGTIRSVGIVSADVKGDKRVGALIGSNSGIVSDSFANGKVVGNGYVGGLVGYNDGGSINSSYANNIVSENSENSEQAFGAVGGLVGHNRYGRVSDSYATGDVYGSTHTIGGLVGYNRSSTVNESYATGNVSGNSAVGGLVGGNPYGMITASYATGSVSGGQQIGGLLGYNDSGTTGGDDPPGTVSGSYATGNVSGEGDYIGGLIGSNRDKGIVSGSYATGKVSGKKLVGGLAGSNTGIASASYATGSVSGEDSVGGLVGGNSNSVIAVWSTGVVSGNVNVGGLVGSNSGSVTVAYWDVQTSGTVISDGGKGKTTAELQYPIGYTDIYGKWNTDLDNADKDFDPITGIDDVWDFGTSSQYPALKADINGDGVATWQEFGNQRPQSTAASMPTSTTGVVDSNARPSAEVFGELVRAGLLVSVWRYHNATQSWDAYDPNIPAELNDLTHAAPKDIVWLKVTETTQFQGRTLHKGWNLIALK